MKTKILVVDDEAAMTRMIQRALERTGDFEVRTETQATAAVAAARQFRPDLVFLDVMMPEMQGDEVATAIDADPELKGTPYVFLTAIVTREEAAATDGVIGGRLFLAKPVKLQDMLDMIKRVLGS